MGLMDQTSYLCLPGQPVTIATGGNEHRTSLENPAVSIADPDAIAEAFGWSVPTDSGEAVNTQRALSLSAVWAAVKMISGDVSRLPMQTYRRRPAGLRPIADDEHPAWPMIQPLGMANGETSVLKLWRRVMVHALLYENGYVWIDRANDGRVLGMYQLLSDRTIVVRKGGRLWVVTETGDVSTGDTRLRAVRYEDVIHLEGLCLDGLVGCDLVHQAREDIGVALASRKFKSKFFGDGMHAGGILQVPPGASSKSVQAVESAIKEQHSGSNKAFRSLVLRDGFKWHSTQVHPEQAQLTDIDESQIRELCRRFLLQPGRLGLRNSVSYNSLEMERRDYHDTTLSYWLSGIRSEVNTKLLTEQERRDWLIDYNVSLALLWADASTLITVATQGVNARDSNDRSIFDSNEVRGWFGMPERDDGEEPGSGTSDAVSDGGTDGGSDSDIPSDTAPAESDAVRSACRDLLAAEFARLVRRWNVQAERAQNRGGLNDWRSGYYDDRQATLAADAVGPAVRAARACGAVADEGIDAAGTLWMRYDAALAGGQQADADTLAAALAAELTTTATEAASDEHGDDE